MSGDRSGHGHGHGHDTGNCGSRGRPWISTLLLLVACGGGASGTRTIGHRAGAEGAPRELVLYRDGALVRERMVVDVAAGTTRVTVPLPEDVGAGGLVARVVAGEARLGTMTVVDPALMPGDRVAVVDGGRTVRGVLRWSGAREMVLEDEGGVRVILDPRHVVREEPGAATRRVDVEVLADAAGKAELEVTYVTRRLRWVADYTLIMDPAVERAELHGALGIDDTAGIAYEDAQITLVDTARPIKITAYDQAEKAPSDKVARPKKPRAEQPVTEQKPVETPRTTLPFTVDVRPGTQSVSLLAGPEVVPARETLVYDPVGDDRDQTGRQPAFDRDFALDRRSTAVSQSIDVDLAGAAELAGLPAGTVRLVERTPTGELAPLGESRIFERASAAEKDKKIARTASVAVGRAADVEGKRRRREFTLDTDGKRLVEEFEIELENRGERDVEVIVREHLYRGKNWVMAYYSAARIEQEGEQKVAMTARVPAKGTTRVVYRVVYWW